MPAAPFAGFAVINLETTGLFPGGHDRVVEIGIVDLDPSLRLVAEWTTSVNPCRDIGPTNIHGITASEVIDAAVFAEIVGDVAAFWPTAWSSDTTSALTWADFIARDVQ